MENLRKLRESKGLSQQKLATKICVSQQSVAQYEKGVHEPDIQTLTRLSRFFGVSVDYLIENTKVPYRIEEADKYILNEEEQQIISLFRILPQNAKAALVTFLTVIRNP